MTDSSDAAILARIRDHLAVIDPDAAIEAVTLHATIADLDVESMTVMNVVAEIEDDLDVRVPEDELGMVETVRDLVRLFQRQL
ncbi:MAG TPA: acyl carrier protein [Thermoleophilaceae bacterium]|jgi:acyl carrier protein